MATRVSDTDTEPIRGRIMRAMVTLLLPTWRTNERTLIMLIITIIFIIIIIIIIIIKKIMIKIIMVKEMEESPKPVFKHIHLEPGA
jgi:flagellar biosynthesis/type III secretory pathway M-ring protein FliF/YscJ